MTPEQLAEIKARRAAITAGEWVAVYGGTWEGNRLVIPEWFISRDGDYYAIATDVSNSDTGEPSEANAAFIASAPSDIDALLDYIERLEVKLDSVYNAKPQTIAATVESTSAHWPPD